MPLIGLIQHLGPPLAAVIRHSKHPAAGTTGPFPHPAWAAFLSMPATVSRPQQVATITKIGTDTLATAVELRFDRGEWSAFLAGAADGEFDFTDQLAA